MNLEKAKEEFLKFVRNYDEKNSRINLKMEHSLRVMNISKKIAENLGLTKEKIELATLIGLLHDIGRFEQVKRYNTFSDFMSIDHGNLGVEILQKDNYIRKYIEEDKYDEIILKAIKNHNKYAIEKGLNEEEVLFSKIIRDADKLDIFYESVTLFWQEEEKLEKVENSIVTKEVLDQFNRKILVDRQKRLSDVDHVVGMISFIFDINFKYSFQTLQKEDYVEKMIRRFKFKSKETQDTIETINKLVDEYIKERLRD